MHVKVVQRSVALVGLLATFLGFCLLSLYGGGRQRVEIEPGWSADEKISPVLLREVRFLRDNPDYDYPIPVIVQLEPRFFAEEKARRAHLPHRPDALDVIHGYRGRLTSQQIGPLLSLDEVRYVTLDAPIRATVKPGHGGGSAGPADVNLRSIGADLAGAMGFDGEGISVAVFDSGIRDHPDGAKPVGVVDFTSGAPVFVNPNQSSGIDNYGHGTHVYGIIGGSGRKSGGAIQGVAPQVRPLDIKVVGDDGTGRTSNLIAAVDWLIVNHEQYGVRIANLSLGHPPIESYTVDPLCQAVRRMVDAGIVTVVSAGNLGKDNLGNPIWGGISSPGNDPSVITVGAINNQGTATHTDDVATSYSSRGPTYLDNLFKPDLAAPGNRIASLLAKFSYLHLNYPELQIDDYYIRLSGSSMAAAYVSGAAALMLDANPQLTPRMVKAILLLTAVKMQAPHYLEQGNGLLNVYTAVQVAQAIDVESQLVTHNVIPHWDLDGEPVWAGGAFAFSDRVAYSPLVDASLNGSLWGSGFVWVSGLFWTEGTFWVGSVFDAPSEVYGDSSAVSDGVFWSDSFYWAESTLSTDGFLWVEGVFSADSFFWTDNSVTSAGEIYGESNAGHDYRGDS